MSEDGSKKKDGEAPKEVDDALPAYTFTVDEVLSDLRTWPFLYGLMTFAITDETFITGRTLDMLLRKENEIVSETSLLDKNVKNTTQELIDRGYIREVECKDVIDGFNKSRIDYETTPKLTALYHISKRIRSIGSRMQKVYEHFEKAKAAAR